MKAKRVTNEFGETFFFHGDSHSGWEIGYGGTGAACWRALRYGVGMRANTREALVRMIDQRVADELAWRRSRQEEV